LTLRVSRVSRTAAILIILLGILTLAAGIATAMVSETVAGVAFLVLGIFLYWFLYRFTRRVEREITEEEED
jgi:membrane protein implicated in regulation of membrane protease activity